MSPTTLPLARRNHLLYLLPRLLWAACISLLLGLFAPAYAAITAYVTYQTHAAYLANNPGKGSGEIMFMRSNSPPSVGSYDEVAARLTLNSNVTNAPVNLGSAAGYFTALFNHGAGAQASNCSTAPITFFDSQYLTDGQTINITITCTVPDTTPPTVLSAATSTDGSTINVTWSEDLDYYGDGTEFTVKQGGAALTVTKADVNGEVLTLTVTPAITSGTTVTLDYDSSSYTVYDMASNSAASFSGKAVTNNSQVGAPSPPTIASLSPASGPTTGGTSITITGTNLAGATAVKFGAASATMTSNTATKIIATAPAGSVGTVNVTVTTPSGTSATSAATQYSYYSPLSTAAGSLTNVSCRSGSNGSAAVSPTGGVPPYTYSWAPSGGTAATATGLTAGAYTVAVTDASNAQVTRTFTITQPATALGATGTSTNPSTNGGTNGSATVTPTGGTPAYTYSWAPSGGSAATATGLAAGNYTVTITDANACQLTQSFTLHQPPSAPTAVTATAGNGSASVSFTAPSSTGGSPITSYSVTSSPAGGSASCQAPPATSCTVTGLTNGTSYTFTVTATNSAGTSAASAASNSVTPKATQTISFANPGAQNFGTSPTLTATSDSGLTPTFSSSTMGICTITSGGLLTFVTTGSCTINADQAGNDSYLPALQVSRSFTVNPVTPGTPTAVSATAGNGLASVSFTAPSSTGGSPITSYSVTSSPAGGSASCQAPPATSCTVTGLTNGTSYTFTVTATNSAGTSAASAASNSVTPKATQTISFANPGAQNFGTSPTLTATSDSGLTPTFSSSTTGICTITSGGLLTFVTTGSCTINADQAGNDSYLPALQVSRSFTVNPVTPGTPTAVSATAGNGLASVSFTAPSSTGGSPITSYSVTSSPAGGSASCQAPPATSCTVTGLTNGTSYTFTVTATNSAGTSAASAASNSITPASVPSAPTAVTATAGNGSASVSFTAPSSNGGSPITGYSVTSSPAGGSTSCQAPPATSCAVTGLTNGTAYTFTVTATNSAGTSAASAASNSVTPKMAQSITFAQPANQRLDATLTLSATASSGLPVSFSVDATTQAVCQINGTTLSFSSSGSCTVHADQAGNGVYLPATQVSHTLTVHTAAPGAPTNVVAMAGNTQAQVSFAAPHDVGTSPITGYEVTIQPGGAKVSGSASPIVVPGLSNGVTYTFTVATKNATDTGAASSPSNAVTPQGVIHGIVPTPTIGTGTTGTATASTAALDPTLDPNCRLAGAQFASEVPPGYSVSYGSFEFLATDCQHGVSISLTYPQPLPPGVRFMKFGPPSLGAADEWMDWTSKVQLSNGGRTVTYSVLDNGAGDSDTRLGLIADPIIPAALSVPPTTAATIPTLNEWGVILLSAFLGVLGWSQTRRRYS